MEILKSILMFLYPILCTILPCLVYQTIASKKREDPKPMSCRHRLWSYIFILYVFLVMEVTGIGTIWDIGDFGAVIRPDEINLIPFQWEEPVSYLLNAVMFLPLGCLLPLIWENYRRLLPTVAAGAAFSLAIELGQLFNRRQTDIDDLIMNVLGTLIGYGIWYVFCKMTHAKQKQDMGPGRKEAIVYLGLSVLGRFLLYHGRFAAYLLYGG